MQLAITHLEALGDARLRERADDLRDVEAHLLMALQGEAQPLKWALPEHAVVMAAELLPSELMALDRERLAAICLSGGGATSHVAILAAALAAAQSACQTSDGVAIARSKLPDRFTTAWRPGSEAPKGVAPVKTLLARPSQKFRTLYTALITDGELRPVTCRTWMPLGMNGDENATGMEISNALPGCTSTKSLVTTPIDPATCRRSLTTAERLLPVFDSL